MRAHQPTPAARVAEAPPRDLVRRAASRSRDPARAAAELRAALEGEPLAFLLLFASSEYEADALSAALGAAFGDLPVLGCTTAGEIGPEGYTEGGLVALGFPARRFSIAIRRIDRLDAYSASDAAAIVGELRASDLRHAARGGGHAAALLLVDGLAMREEALVSSLAPLLGSVPLVGGSAGDGLDFRRTRILCDGRFRENAAVLALIRTDCPMQAFCIDHFRPTEQRLVVTAADPARRLVRRINGAPAAPEYARVIGKDPEQLSPYIFASHPVLVRMGGRHYVRAILRVEPNGDLRFYGAIDEGVVLAVAEPAPLADHLDASLAGLAAGAGPDVILAFDCILRRLEAQRSQATREVSRVLRRRRVIGFNTYGEQYRALHVNQTMTGIAIYPPGSSGASP